MSEILSDNALERMVEDKNEDAIGNLDQVKDTFFVVVCPYTKSIEMDRRMAQSIFQKWNRSARSGWKKTLFPL